MMPAFRRKKIHTLFSPQVDKRKGRERISRAAQHEGGRCELHVSCVTGAVLACLIDKLPVTVTGGNLYAKCM